MDLKSALAHGELVPLSMVQEFRAKAHRDPEDRHYRSTFLDLATRYHAQAVKEHGRYSNNTSRGIIRKAERMLAEASRYPLIVVELGPGDVVELMTPLRPIHEDARETVA